MTYRRPTDEPTAAEIRKDHTGMATVVALIVAATALLTPVVGGAVRMASDHYRAQAVLHQENFASIRGNAGRASLVAEAGR